MLKAQGPEHSLQSPHPQPLASAALCTLSACCNPHSPELAASLPAPLPASACSPHLSLSSQPLHRPSHHPAGPSHSCALASWSPHRGDVSFPLFITRGLMSLFKMLPSTRKHGEMARLPLGSTPAHRTLLGMRRALEIALEWWRGRDLPRGLSSGQKLQCPGSGSRGCSVAPAQGQARSQESGAPVLGALLSDPPACPSYSVPTGHLTMQGWHRTLGPA